MTQTEGTDPVVVVGAGPTGLTAALLLARLGVPVVLLERHRDVYPLPRAVHLDDEVFRLLQGAGVAAEFAAISRPSGGLRLLDARHRTIGEFTRGSGRLGYPQANMFDQPDLERVLRDRLRQTGVELRAPVEVLSVEPGDRPAVVLRDLGTGRVARLAAAAVLGCDGAESVVRPAVGARWRDLHAAERWLVLDVRCAQQLDVWDGVHQVCDGRRAATFMQVGPERYRWEFQLGAGETAEDLEIAPLVRPWLGSLPVEGLGVVRRAGYTFRARLADRWRLGRLFLLGDAAHLTPPFVGQGLGAGLRDAGNLSWKLARVLQGRAPEQLLDTYERERRPHARAMIRLAVTAGWAMTGGQGPAALARRVLLGAVCRLPGGPRLLDRGSPALTPGPLVPRPRPARGSLVGTLSPQPRTGGDLLLDDLLGSGFAVLAAVPPDPALVDLARRLGAPLLRVDELEDGGVLRTWLRRGGAAAAVLRPDRAVLVTAACGRTPGAQIEREHPAVLALVGAGPVRRGVAAAGT